jgi:hypothetical protein
MINKMVCTACKLVFNSKSPSDMIILMDEHIKKTKHNRFITPIKQLLPDIDETKEASECMSL